MGFLSLIRASATSESLEIRSTRSKIHDLILRYQAIQKPVADLNVPTLEKTIIKMLHMLDLCMKSNGNNDSVIKFVSLLTNLIDSILDPIIKAIPRNGVVFSNWATAGLHVLSRELNDAIPPKRQLVGTIFSRIFYTVDVGGTLPDVNRRIEEALNRFWINLGGNGLNPSIYNSSRELIPDRETQDLPIDALMIRALFQNFGPPFRILIIGRANSGKTTILRNFFGTSDPLVVRDKNGNEIDRLYLENQSIMGSMHDIEHEITSQSNPLFVIHDSKGFEAGSTQEMQKVRDFIRQRSVASCIHRRLHVIWYCIPMDEDRILSPAELSFFNDGTRDVPVIALFTKWDGQIVQSFHEIYNRGNGGKTIGEAREEAACHAEDVLKSHYLPAIYRTLHPPKGHVVLKGGE
ncbi:hypothetical protein FRC03_012541 [Tulasnella sp. 419]|nr:hypothetical protein FRC03_012541 [Tulasnella sp. 419]